MNNREKQAGRASAIGKSMAAGLGRAGKALVPDLKAVTSPVERAMVHGMGGMATGGLAGLAHDKVTGQDTNPLYWMAGGAAAGASGRSLAMAGENLGQSASKLKRGLGTAARYVGRTADIAGNPLTAIPAGAVQMPLYGNRMKADGEAAGSRSGMQGMDQANKEKGQALQELLSERRQHSQALLTNSQEKQDLQEQLAKVEPKDWSGTASSLWDKTPNWGKGLAIGAGALGAGHLINKMTKDDEDEEGSYMPGVGTLAAGAGTGLALSSMAGHNWRNLVSPEWWQKSSSVPLILYKHGVDTPGVPQDPYAAITKPPLPMPPPTPGMGAVGPVGAPKPPTPAGSTPKPLPNFAAAQRNMVLPDLVGGIGGASGPGGPLIGQAKGQLAADAATSVGRNDQWRNSQNPNMKPEDVEELHPSELGAFANDRKPLTTGPVPAPPATPDLGGTAKGPAGPNPTTGPVGAAKPPPAGPNAGGVTGAVGAGAAGPVAAAGSVAQTTTAPGVNKPETELHPVAEKALAKQFGGDMNKAQEAAWSNLQQQVPPEVQQKGPEGIWEWMKHIWSNLSPTQQILLGVGLALGAVGLISSMSGGGGGMMGPLIGAGGAALAGYMGYQGYQQGQSTADASGGLAPPGTGGTAGPMIAGHTGAKAITRVPPGTTPPDPGGTQGGATDVSQEITRLSQDPATKAFFQNGRVNKEAVVKAVMNNDPAVQPALAAMSPALKQQMAKEVSETNAAMFMPITGWTDPNKAVQVKAQMLQLLQAGPGGAGTVNPNQGVGATLPPDSEIYSWADNLIRNPNGPEAERMLQSFASMPDEVASHVLDRVRDRKLAVGTPEAVAASGLYTALIQVRGLGALRNLRTQDPKSLLGHKDQRVYDEAAARAGELAKNPEQAKRLGYMSDQDRKQLGSIAQVEQDRFRLSKELRYLTAQLREAQDAVKQQPGGPGAAELSRQIEGLMKLREAKMQTMRQYGSQ